jgi:hypothetical protein
MVRSDSLSIVTILGTFHDPVELSVCDGEVRIPVGYARDVLVLKAVKSESSCRSRNLPFRVQSTSVEGRCEG